VVVSESTLKEFLSRGYPKENFEIVYNALDHTKFPFERREKYPRPTITYFGRLKKYKSIEQLFYAFQKVKQIISDAQLFVIGRGDYEPDLRKLAEELGISQDVTFWGYVDEEQKIELLSKSHCVVNTSIKEGWGITNLESNACGTLVISANVEGLRDSVKDGLSGLLYEFGNIDDLANKIISVLIDKELFDRLSDGAIEWARNFSWDISANKMIEIIERVIKDFEKTKE